MISAELIRRYPFFAGLDEAQQRLIASIAQENTFDSGATILEEGQSADALYLLLSGSIDLYAAMPGVPDGQVLVGEINPGEPFSISALIPPHILTHTVRAASRCHTIRIDATALRALCDAECHVGYTFMRQIATAAMERLHFTRVQLAAERA